VRERRKSKSDIVALPNKSEEAVAWKGVIRWAWPGVPGANTRVKSKSEAVAHLERHRRTSAHGEENDDVESWHCRAAHAKIGPSILRRDVTIWL